MKKSFCDLCGAETDDRLFTEWPSDDEELTLCLAARLSVYNPRNAIRVNDKESVMHTEMDICWSCVERIAKSEVGKVLEESDGGKPDQAALLVS